MGGELRIVRDHNNSAAVIVGQALEDRLNDLAGLGVQIAGGFVCQDDRRIIGKRPRNGHPLALTARQLLGNFLTLVIEAERRKQRGRTVLGQRLSIEMKPLHRGNVAGGILFGIGWSIAGMCPGPILVNIGEGKIYALAALAGALVGAGLLGSLYPALQRSFALPPLEAGTGEG